jgi:hypothetical protein
MLFSSLQDIHGSSAQQPSFHEVFARAQGALQLLEGEVSVS